MKKDPKFSNIKETFYTQKKAKTHIHLKILILNIEPTHNIDFTLTYYNGDLTD